MKVWLKHDAPDEITVRSGDYDRTFNRAESASGGFEVSEDECRILEPTGYFTREKPKAPTKDPKKPPKAPEAPSSGAKAPEEG